jgi:hypothetical protein
MKLEERIVVADVKFMTLEDGWSTFEKFEREKHGIYPHRHVESTVVIEHVPHRSIDRLVKAGLLGEKILWIRCKREMRSTALAALGNPAVVELDTFKVKGEPRLSKTLRKRRTFKVYSDYAMSRQTSEIDMSLGGFYVETASGGYGRRRSHFIAIGAGSLDVSTFSGIVKTSVKLGIIPDESMVLIKTDGEVLGSNWVNLADHLKDKLKEKLDPGMFTGTYGKNVNHVNSGLKSLTNYRAPNAPEDIGDLIRDAARLIASLSQPTTYSNSDKAFHALQKLGVTVEQPEIACPIDAMNKRYAAIAGKYRILAQIIEANRWGRNNDAQEALDEYFALLARPARPSLEQIDHTEEQLKRAA